MNHPEENQMITSKEVLDKTGISRATLNNYIKMGILPKPVVGRPQSSLGGVKQIGYFPVDVLEKINAVQRYKRQGYAMEDIVERLTRLSHAGDFESIGQGEMMDGVKSQPSTVTPLPSKDTLEKLTLTTTDLNAPEDKTSHDVLDILSRRVKIIQELLNQSMPGVASYCVLVAGLQDSVKISAELLPKDYFDLVNQLWKMLQHTVDRHEGIYGKSAEQGVAYYFIEKPGSHYRMNALCCALEIKAQMRVFDQEWKLRKGWLDDLYVNMGISEGLDFLGTVHSSPYLELTTLGDSMYYANRLSDFARQGAIWATKSLISRLDPKDMASLQFGVNRTYHDRRVWIENSFCRLGDLLGEEAQKTEQFIDIAALSITEIVARKTRSSDM